MATKPRPDDHVPDLAALLREKMTRATTAVSVPLAQDAAIKLEELEAKIEQTAADEDRADRRMSSKSPLVDLAKEADELRKSIEASVVTFRFEPYDEDSREQVRQAMRGRDDSDELNLRAIAAMCVEVVDHEGNATPSTLDWEYFRDLRKTLGARMFDRIEQATERVSGGSWSVPFSPNASLILATLK